MDIQYTTDLEKVVMIIGRLRQYEADWLTMNSRRDIQQLIVDDVKTTQEQKDAAQLVVDNLTSNMDEADQLHELAIANLNNFDSEVVNKAKEQFGL